MTATVSAQGEQAAPVADGGGAKMDPAPIIRVLPVQYTKVVYLVRHGEGFHNVAGHADHEAYKSWYYHDAHLTQLGWRQAEALGRHVRQRGIAPQLVVTSTLARALETAVGAFGGARWREGSAEPPLMVATDAQEGVRTARDAVSSSGCPPFVAIEGCREHLGVHPCDARRPLSRLRALFPGVDFSGVADEEDTMWTPDHRESKAEIQERGRAFLAWLLRRPERCIAVVSHSSFLHFMLSAYVAGTGQAVEEELQRWFQNCELRTVVLADEGAHAHAHADCHFPGGHHVQ